MVVALVTETEIDTVWPRVTLVGEAAAVVVKCGDA